MNILFVAGFFLQKRSSAAVRNNALVEGLRALGHNVFIKHFGHQYLMLA